MNELDKLGKKVAEQALKELTDEGYPVSDWVIGHTDCSGGSCLMAFFDGDGQPIPALRVNMLAQPSWNESERLQMDIHAVKAAVLEFLDK